MPYFLKLYYLTKEQRFLQNRSFRKTLFDVGDILSLFFRSDYLSFYFQGLCIAIKKPNSPDFSFVVRNILSGVGIEFNLSFFYNRTFFFKVNDFRRKEFYYPHAKLYYLKSEAGNKVSVN